MSEWVGYGVSLYLGEPLGWYQGIITETTKHSITLKKAFRNGFPYPTSTVTLNAADIKELKIVFTPENGPKDGNTNNTSDSLPEEDLQCDYIKKNKRYNYSPYYEKRPKQYSKPKKLS